MNTLSKQPKTNRKNPQTDSLHQSGDEIIHLPKLFTVVYFFLMEVENEHF